MLAILDYKAGNQTSVRRALEHLGIPCQISADEGVLHAADGIIFPGVGAAGQAMQQLENTGMDTVLRTLVAAGKPLLGVCLGCQILLHDSEENDTRTLGVLNGHCVRFAESLCENGQPIRIPHMGWNRLYQLRQSPLLAGIAADAQFYFVHSYYTVPDPALVLAECEYGERFCAVYGRDGLWAVQFHPEKSGRPGLAVLNNFYHWCIKPCHKERPC